MTPSADATAAADRRPTAVDALAERHLDAQLQLDPLTATIIGVPGHDELMPDLSPAGLQAQAELDRQTLRGAARGRPRPTTSTR